MNYDELEFIITKINSGIGVIPCILYVILIIYKKNWIPLVIININIAIISIIFEICYFFPKIYEVDFSCKLQVFLTCYSEFSTLLWTTIYSLIAFLLFIFNTFFEKNSFFVYVISFIVGYLIPLIYPIYGFFKESYSKDPNYFYCWFKSEEQKYYVYIICSIFLINLFLIIIILIYIKYQLNILLETTGRVKIQFKQYFYKFIFFLIAQILIFLQILYDNKDIFGLEFKDKKQIIVIITHIFSSLEGMIVTIAYCYTYEIFSEIKLLLCCKLESNSFDDNDLNESFDSKQEISFTEKL